MHGSHSHTMGHRVPALVRQHSATHCPIHGLTRAAHAARTPQQTRSRIQAVGEKTRIQSRDLKSDAELFAEEVGAQDSIGPEAALPDDDNVQQLRQQSAKLQEQVRLR